LQYTGTGTFTERDAAARRAVIEASGKDKRGNGTAAAVITASLHAEGDASTRVTVDTDLKITGRPAQFGRGVIEDVGGAILGQFAECLAHTLAAPGEPAPPAPEPAPTLGEHTTPVRPAPPAPPPSADESPGLDLASVVGPAVLRRLQPIAAAAVVTAVVTAGVTAIVRWWSARRRP
jgi:hypothetical protein